ncbi:hypothetical protein WR25_08424 [Diploscapter pachys]|uniref:Major sperm protein n=1 Tax=Diploscapter pachys TaxID=2018661 RepID=A0A2A2KTS7_9BILA|nr:hypothetical protein WR25_08424 [Diploscapter pachys]
MTMYRQGSEDQASLRRYNSFISDSDKNVLAIQEIRYRILQAGKSQAKMTLADAARISNEDWWINSFLQSQGNDVDVAYAVILECLRWRHNFDVDNISLLLLKPLLDRKVMYLHGVDLYRNPILWINLANYNGSSEEHEFNQLFTFWLERHYMDTCGSQLLLLINMTNMAAKNMYFNTFKFILHALKYYYPNAVNDIVIFESPSILNASWKVIKSWADSGHPLFNQVTRDSVHQFVEEQYLPTHMGGTDPFEFTMDELAHCLPVAKSDNNQMDSDKENGENENGTVNGNGNGLGNGMGVTNGELLLSNKLNNLELQIKRAVKFDDDEDTVRKEPLTLPRRPSKGPTNRRPSMSNAIKPLIENRNSAPEEQWVDGQFVKFSPRDELQLRKVDGESDLIDVVAIKNVSSGSLMFKIKTTSPEKFRVRPSTGIVAVGATESVRVYLQHEYRYSCSKEKFLILAMETNETNIENFGEAWKSAKNKVEQKMKCKIAEDCVLDDAKERKSGFLTEQQETVQSFRQQIVDLQYSYALLMKILAVLIVFLIIVFYYDRSNYASLQSNFDKIVQEHKTLITQFAQRLQTLENQPRTIIVNSPSSAPESTIPLTTPAPIPVVTEQLHNHEPAYEEDL